MKLNAYWNPVTGLASIYSTVSGDSLSLNFTASQTPNCGTGQNTGTLYRDGVLDTTLGSTRATTLIEYTDLHGYLATSSPNCAKCHRQFYHEPVS